MRQNSVLQSDPKPSIHLANALYREGKIRKSIETYTALLDSSNIISRQAESSLERISRFYNRSKHPLFFGRHKNVRVAVVCHLYHKEGFNELRSSISHLEDAADFFLTGPFSDSDPAVIRFCDGLTKSQYFRLENLGRDMRPFASIFAEIRHYDICLKTHTKKGVLSLGELWRDLLYKDTYGTLDLCKRVIDSFMTNDSVALIGLADLFLDGASNLLANKHNINRIIERAYGKKIDLPAKWGFIAGTIFWFRPSAYIEVFEKCYNDMFEIEESRIDGAPEHAFERIFGLVPAIKGNEILLIKKSSDGNSYTLNYPNQNTDFQLNAPSKILEDINNVAVKRNKIKGSIDEIHDGMLTGWICVPGQDEIVQSHIIVDCRVKLSISANEFRSDLKNLGFNNGCHGFRVRLGQELFDGETHLFELYDSKKGLCVAARKIKLSKRARRFNGFDSFLRLSLTEPEQRRPLVEEDMRVLAAMEAATTFYSKKNNAGTKFSIILPTYNRRNILRTAITSALNQTYRNFELIIIDDGSVDGTDLDIARISDPRIRLLKLTTNSGVSLARNAGLEVATGDYICYLDSDNEWDIRHLACLATAIDMHQKPDCIYTAQLLYLANASGFYGYRFGLYNVNLLSNANYIDLNCFCHAREEGYVSADGLFNNKLPRFVDWDFIFKKTLGSRVLALPVLTSKYFLKRVPDTLTAVDSLLPYLSRVQQSNVDALKTYAAKTALRCGIKRKVSIIIPSFQASSELAKCIASIKLLHYEQIQQGLIEVIIVDNCSGPAELALITESAREVSAKLVLLDKNYGFTHAINIGIAHANDKSDLMLLNNDAVLGDGAIALMQHSAGTNDNKVIVAPAQILDGFNESIAQHVPFANTEFEADVTLSSVFQNIDSISFKDIDHPLTLTFAPFFCVYIPRKVFKLAGPLRVATGRHYRSDRSYCSLLREILGIKIIYNPYARVYHSLQSSTKLLAANPNDYNKIFELNTWSEDEVMALNLEVPEWMEVLKNSSAESLEDDASKARLGSQGPL